VRKKSIKTRNFVMVKGGGGGGGAIATNNKCSKTITNQTIFFYSKWGKKERKTENMQIDKDNMI
jgi:hypothetical protein